MQDAANTNEITTLGPYCFGGTVKFPVAENRAAHGCVLYVDVRADGMRRQRNVNGWHEEIGEWFRP